MDRVDYCTFGNTKPFRIRIVNQYNDNHDYFYAKKADASRIYGLELEQLLSPNEINFHADRETLVEEHIIGVPGDDFIDNFLEREDLNEVRLAKEFIKFNERCFVRLLGDMRAYNYAVEMTPDFEQNQYRVRAIDFDQQCYEGRRSFYRPQFFKNNLPVVKLCSHLINLETSHQYQREERTLIKRRFNASIRLAYPCLDPYQQLAGTDVRRYHLKQREACPIAYRIIPHARGLALRAMPVPWVK